MQHFAVDAVLLLLFSCLLYLLSSSAAQVERIYVDCNSTASNYTSGSVFEENLNRTIASLVSSSSLSSGFNITSVGQNLDVVYGLVYCIAEQSDRDCQACANIAAMEIRSRCPNQKEAYMFYNNCSIRYSDWRFFSTADSAVIATIYNVNIATDGVLFNRQLRNLLKNISSQAASSPSKYYLGITSHTENVNIYAMMQCTKDLTENSCLTCLQGLISYLPTDLSNVGARFFSMSCNLRYETYSFFLSPLPPSLVPEKNGTSTTPTAKTSGQAGKNNTSEIVLFVVIPAAIALVVIICGCCLWRITRRKRVGNSEDAHEDREKSVESLLMNLSTLQVATKNFSDSYKLGQGGFGPVYKGKLLDGREIAVKRLARSSGQGLEELKTEVVLVAKLLHRNLIRLLGFCLEDGEKLLVYEYLPNGSLDRVLFDQTKRFPLEWERRYKIIVGIARGLLYLHEDSQLRIIHRDLKASNILLDENMNPKISDFGLARLFGGSQTQGNTNRIAGTYGYLAPEYAKKGNFSTKSDVYSFGVLVLEIVAGRKNSSFSNGMNLPSYAWQHWAKGTGLDLIDPTLGDQWTRHEVLKCIHIGLLCVQEAPADRPMMSAIATMLSGYTASSFPAPSQPAFFVTNSTVENPELGLIKNDPGASSPLIYAEAKPESSKKSLNDVTISDIGPR
ncbi:hypothetical protein F2P56_024314 [Juglans regia]|uniref:Receptor-like protein kinase At4g00960 n=2 Tax=Juglans regia TaxID=51240 RepID=A0A833TZN4_JUGRE|nr:putative receptor-like protein kinase At4g00960 [Juglans regia]KAF5454667.1 hypothetical protein F2P56_024314 [Juglans regia]